MSVKGLFAVLAGISLGIGGCYLVLKKMNTDSAEKDAQGSENNPGVKGNPGPREKIPAAVESKNEVLPVEPAISAKETPKSDETQEPKTIFTTNHYFGIIGRSKGPSHVWDDNL